jgi:hypothetical protein
LLPEGLFTGRIFLGVYGYTVNSQKNLGFYFLESPLTHGAIAFLDQKDSKTDLNSEPFSQPFHAKVKENRID